MISFEIYCVVYMDYIQNNSGEFIIYILQIKEEGQEILMVENNVLNHVFSHYHCWAILLFYYIEHNKLLLRSIKIKYSTYLILFM